MNQGHVHQQQLADAGEGHGRDLLVAMAAQPEWIGHRYPAWRIGARLVPHGKGSASVQKVFRLAGLEDALTRCYNCLDDLQQAIAS